MACIRVLVHWRPFGFLTGFFCHRSHASPEPLGLRCGRQSHSTDDSLAAAHRVGLLRRCGVCLLRLQWCYFRTPYVVDFVFLRFPDHEIGLNFCGRGFGSSSLPPGVGVMLCSRTSTLSGSNSTSSSHMFRAYPVDFSEPFQLNFLFPPAS